jgi:hypothetical protein
MVWRRAAMETLKSGGRTMDHWIQTGPGSLCERKSALQNQGRAAFIGAPRSTARQGFLQTTQAQNSGIRT